jgi:hypothetical protein
MKRRTFLKLALCLVMVRGVRVAQGGTMALKGFHLFHPFTDAAALNQLGAAWFCGTDETLRVIRDPAQHPQFEALTATYVYRIPHDASVQEIQNVQQLANFNNEFIVMNEPDLAGFAHQYTADRVTEAITNIQAADPTRNNKIMLCAGSQYAGTAYVGQVLTLLSPAIRALIDGLAWHYYPEADHAPGGIYDENRLRNFLNVVCPFTAAQGFSKAWLSEFGWTAEANQERVANRLPRFVGVINAFPILKRFNVYGANVPQYQTLTGAVGEAFGGM